jgi:hypothetical protein
MYKKLLGIVLMVVASAASAAAATISFNDSVITTTTPDTLNFTIPLFDNSLGPLTGVTIEFSTAMSGAFNVFNSSDAAGTFNGTMSGAFVLDGVAPLPMPLLTLTPAAVLGPRAVDAGETIVFNVNAADSASYVTSNAAELALFVGVGNFLFDGTGETLVSGSSTFNPLLFGSNLSTETTLTVTYEYRDQLPGVPEPMSFYLMGGGLLALGFIRPRSSKKSA